MRYLEGVYIDSVDVVLPDGETTKLDVWMNPETRKLVGVRNMDDVPATQSFITDPYDETVRLVFANTFSGLPK